MLDAELVSFTVSGVPSVPVRVMVPASATVPLPSANPEATVNPSVRRSLSSTESVPWAPVQLVTDAMIVAARAPSMRVLSGEGYGEFSALCA